jgi:hypothetical protein
MMYMYMYVTLCDFIELLTFAYKVDNYDNDIISYCDL